MLLLYRVGNNITRIKYSLCPLFRDIFIAYNTNILKQHFKVLQFRSCFAIGITHLFLIYMSKNVYQLIAEMMTTLQVFFVVFSFHFQKRHTQH